MQILTLENTTYLLNKIPDEVDDDMRFSVLDNSDPSNPDFFFVPLIFFVMRVLQNFGELS